MKSGRTDEIQSTRSGSPSTAEPAGTSEMAPSTGRGAPRPSAAAQIRDPERYLIIGEHGRGGLGRVSRAHDLDLGRDVAIKELISRGTISEIRFLREALITARLEHPGIVPIHEAGRWPDGTPFYAMKLVAGRPLRDLIAERATVGERIGLLHHVIAVADAIAYAHGRNIIHRDLKPANVIVGDFGETIVIDWGLAKDLCTTADATIDGGSFRSNRDNDLTVAGSVLGTPAYMAPEQERGEHVDQRADVFAIGAMLWELCSLQKVPPTDPRLRHRLLRRAGIDRDLITIIDKSLDPKPDRRYPNAGALASDLKAFKSGARIAARSYSLFALLAHWTRRHRTLAMTLSAAVILAIVGTTLYVREIALARDRAQQERDKAQLAEATLLLDKDPTAAQKLLLSFGQRSPQYSLLVARSRRGASQHTVRLPGAVTELFIDGSSSLAIAITSSGALVSVDIVTGVAHSIDHGLRGAMAQDGNRWIYAKRPPGVSSVTISDTSRPSQSVDVGSRLTDVTAQIVVANSDVYARDNTDMYKLEQTGLVLVRRDVRRIAGNSHVFMLCTTDNKLEVARDGKKDSHTRCAPNRSSSPMVAAGRDYAALLDADTLLVVRNDRALELRTHISGEYALALSSAGVLALSDFDDKAWLVRRGSHELELGPVHASRPIAVAANAQYAAWGYVDGAVIVLDTITNETWEYKGHSTLVTSLAIDVARRAVISTAGSELRIWSIAQSSLTKVASIPSKIFNIVRSKDGMQAAMDASDGVMRIWTRGTQSVSSTHRHNNISFGVAWLKNMPCSGGFDGKVRCAGQDGSTIDVLSGSESVRWLISSPDYLQLVIATADGQIRSFDGALRTLYTHNARPYRMAFSSNARYLASGANDGMIIVYNSLSGAVTRVPDAHAALVTNVVWRNEDLWTAGADGKIKRWSIRNGKVEVAESISETGAVRLFHLVRAGWIANVDVRIVALSLANRTAPIRFDLGRHVEHIDVSPNERYVMATTADELVVIDLERMAVASQRITTDGGGYVGFVDDGTIAISTERSLLSVQPSSLYYIDF